MIAGGEFGHDTAINRMKIDLAVDLVRQKALLSVVNGDGGLIAGGFDCQNTHFQLHLLIFARWLIRLPRSLACLD